MNLKNNTARHSKEAEIKNEVWQIWQILLIAKECFQYSLYLHKPSTQEEQNYLRHSQDFGFIRQILWRMSVIELSKLFCDSKDRDRFNIFHFINKLKKGGHFGDMGISKTTIAKWENQIAINKDTITQILTLRDKVYAHTDANGEKYTKGDLTFQQTEKLIQIIENVIQEIYSTVFQTHAIMDTPIFEKERFNIIKILASEQDRRIKELQENFTKRTEK